jgi:transposase-like protein
MTTEVSVEAVVAESDESVGTVAGVGEELIGRLVSQAREQGLELTGEGGLLQQLTKRVLESALEGEITDHLGRDRHERAGQAGGNARNGHRSKTVITEVGPVELEVPRDRDATFEPKIVRKRQRRLPGVEEMVLSVSARGLTHGEISAHLAEVYGAQVSKSTISTITDKVIEGMNEWQNRPLDSVYPMIFIDCVHVKIRDGQVANRPIYVALAVTVEGTRDILGLWAGDGGEGAKYWLQVLTEIRNRGVADVCMVVCDGLKGLPEAIGTVWPRALTQTCVVHLLRASFRYAARQDWDKIARALKPVYTAPNPAGRRRPVPGVRRGLGWQVPGDRAVVGERLGRVRPVPAVRPRDPAGGVHDQRHRVGQRPHPQGRPSPRALPQQAGRTQMRLHGHHEPGSHRHRPQTLDPALEDRPQRLRDHLRRPTRRRPPITQPNPVTPTTGQTLLPRRGTGAQEERADNHQLTGSGPGAGPSYV